MFIAILGGVGGLICVAGLVITIVVVRSRTQAKYALEEKRRAERAESALAQMSMNQLATGYNTSLARNGAFTGLTQDGTFNPFAQGATFNGSMQGATAMTGGFSGSTLGRTGTTGGFPGFNGGSPSLARNSMTGPTQFYGQQNAFGTTGTTMSTIFDQFGKTYVSQTPGTSSTVSHPLTHHEVLFFPDFLEVNENKDYARTKKISEGAMGEVWLAHASQQALIQRANSYSCVVKMMKPHAKVPWEIFQQEVTISYHIREHANIAQVVGFSRSPLAIVLQYYPEGSLHGLIHNCQVQGFAWSPAWCRSFAIDISRGLSHMHKLSIAHCDIKPGNILIKLGNQSLVAMLSDFGISRILDGQGSSAAVAGFKTHNLNGASISYASPEAIVRVRNGDEGNASHPQVIQAGDVYSLAVVLSEMLTQRKPW